MHGNDGPRRLAAESMCTTDDHDTRMLGRADSLNVVSLIARYSAQINRCVCDVTHTLYSTNARVAMHISLCMLRTSDMPPTTHVQATRVCFATINEPERKRVEQ